MTVFVTLILPAGAQDGLISYGTQKFMPFRADHLDPASALMVNVPRHVAEHFCHNAGFYPMPQETASQFTGTARLYAPHGCGWGGIQYHPDEDGMVTVPSQAVADLLAFPPICPETSRPHDIGDAPEVIALRGKIETLQAMVLDAQKARDGMREMLSGHKETIASLKAQLDERDKSLAAHGARVAELKEQLHAATQPAAEPAKAKAR